MRFVPGQRRLELAAGDFARFGEPPASPAFAAGGRWRAETGRAWHESLRASIETQAAQADAAISTGQWQFEVAVQTVLFCDKWMLVADGRADQIFVPNDAAAPFVVREIKTVSETLPRPPDYWRKNRPSFFVQLALYCHGLAQRTENGGRGVVGVLVLVEPATGVIQELPLGAAVSEWLDPNARLLARFAESRWNSRIRLEHLRLLAPFAEPRAEWSDALRRLEETSARVVFLEAPTGFGKTSLALADALRRLRDGAVSRIVYITGKNSGRLQVFRELDRLVESGALRMLTLHSRAEHEVPGVPNDPEVWGANWRRAAIEPDEIFERGQTSLAEIRALGERAGVPPWEITKALLPLAEFILCDYNYVFSPWQAGVLGGMPGWDAASTLLVVDEAHNLPSRAAEARSVECAAAEAFDTLDALRFAGVRGGWDRHWEAWAEFLDELPQVDAPEPRTLYLARDLCGEIARLWEEQPPFRFELGQDVLNVLEQPAQLLPLLDAGSSDYLLWSPRERTFRAGCLDAAAGIGEVLRTFRRAVLMSATLAPADDFAAACGIGKFGGDGGGVVAGVANDCPTAWLDCEAPWRADAYTIATDVRVDTRLKKRDQHYRTTAESVLALGALEPVVVFFPSYAYAETIQVFIAALAPGFRVAIQPRGATPEQNTAFVGESLLLAHALFLVAGGGLAEGVDMLGGRISRVMVVSPCLPEVTPERAAQMALCEERGDRDAFRTVYLVPALRKVNQALGRLVRGPGQRAHVVLHCRRFAEPAIAALLAPEYRHGTLIRNARELGEFAAG